MQSIFLAAKHGTPYGRIRDSEQLKTDDMRGYEIENGKSLAPYGVILISNLLNLSRLPGFSDILYTDHMQVMMNDDLGQIWSSAESRYSTKSSYSTKSRYSAKSRYYAFSLYSACILQSPVNRRFSFIKEKKGPGLFETIGREAGKRYYGSLDLCDIHPPLNNL